MKIVQRLLLLIVATLFLVAVNLNKFDGILKSFETLILTDGKPVIIISFAFIAAITVTGTVVTWAMKRNDAEIARVAAERTKFLEMLLKNRDLSSTSMPIPSEKRGE